jgi:hypothetical protein
MALELSFVVGMIFGLLGAIMAFLIFYDEYRKHMLGRARLWKEALSGAAVTFCVFLLLSAILGYCVSRLLQ